MELAPKQAGFDAARLERITDHLNRNYIEPGMLKSIIYSSIVE